MVAIMKKDVNTALREIGKRKSKKHWKKRSVDDNHADDHNDYHNDGHDEDDDICDGCDGDGDNGEGP